MILHPLGDQPPMSPEVVPAWNTVAATQQQNAPACWLITQPDHAALAGDLAGQFATPGFPALGPEGVQAIALHDAGWAKYDGGGEGAASQPLRDSAGRPLSFLQVPVRIFVEAWTLSIQCAEERAGAIGGLMVSGHFRRLAEHRLHFVQDTAEDAACIHAFLGRETQQDEARLHRQSRSEAEVGRLIDLLQFCDLLSLYLCCGSRRSVQFPQTIAARPIVLQRDGELCQLDPSPFCDEVSVGVAARRHPISCSEPSTCVLPALLR